MAVANIDDPTELAHLIAGALRIPTEEKQKLLEERNVTKRLRLLSEILARELELVEIGSRIQTQVQSEMDRGQREYILRQQLRAIQEELGEVDEQQAEAEELRKQLERGEPARARALGRRPRAGPLRAAAAAVGRARGDPHLPRVARHAAVVEVHRGQPRPEARARGARQGPLRHRAREGPHPRVPRRAQAEPGGAQLDRRVRRPAGRGEDVARPLDRRGDGARVRADLRGRRARRVRDPRPPAHLHRRDAGHDRARPPRRRVEQPGPDDRRDRQDGRGLPRRPRERDARGARPRAELHLPRPLPRRPDRPLARVLHLHGEPARHDPARAARPHGGRSSCRATRTRTSARSRSATSCRARWSATASAGRRSSSRSPRSTGSSTATRARRACGTSSARSGRSAARSRASSPRARAARSGRSGRRRWTSCSASRASRPR